MKEHCSQKSRIMSLTAVPQREVVLQRLLLSDNPYDALDDQVKDQIISSMWSSRAHVSSPVYFQYFRLECDTWIRSGVAVTIETYGDLLSLIEHLKRHRDAPRNSAPILDFFPLVLPISKEQPSFVQDTNRENLHLPLKDRYPYCNITSAQNSIFLAVRLWVMLNVGSSTINTFVAGRTNLEWPEGQSLDDFIKTSFPASDLGPKLSQWPISLNIRSLERIGGFNIIWTDHLADHLYLNEDLDTINVYHHVQVLEGLQRDDTSDQVLPDHLLLETLQTLALMIPRANSECKRWFQKIHRQNIGDIDKGAGDVELLPWARSPEHYKYWGQRLSIIKDAYNASEPKDLGQWWHDRRSKVQWYTFWVAILVLLLTIIFGLIQSVTGVLQVYYTTHPTQQST